MKTSPELNKIAPALLKAQKSMGSAIKEAENPYYKSKYADMNSVIKPLKEALNAEGISINQSIEFDEVGDYLETTFLHESGQFISSRMRLRTQKENDMQAYGSAVSYARRYSAQALGFLPSSEDDDGENTMSRAATQTVKPSSNGFAVARTAPKEAAPKALIAVAGVASKQEPAATEFSPKDIKTLPVVTVAETPAAKAKVSPFTRAGAKAATSLNGVANKGVL